MRTVQVYVNGEILDLFNDEKISVTSSVQNIQDISKVYTDFSQTFTVPASKQNNKIFGHYYNNDLEEFVAKERQTARIEINYTPFRRGKVQLEGAEIVNGEAQNYRLTFYGEVVTLKDLFSDYKLKDLNYNLQFERNGANVIDTITNTNDLDIRFPLISSEVLWQYGTSGVGDISNSTQSIDFSKLFPAVKVAKVFEAIEDTFGITFNGNFLNDERFTKLFTWWKNEDNAVFNNAVDLDFDLSVGVPTTYSLYPVVNSLSQVNIQFIDQFAFTPLPSDYFTSFGTGEHSVQIVVSNTSSTVDYWIDTYKNGTVINSHLANGNTTFSSLDLGVYIPNVFGLNDVYEFRLRSLSVFTFDFQINYTFRLPYVSTSGTSFYTFQDYTFSDTVSSVSLPDLIDFNLTAPDITVSDYFAGVLKMFNLTCYPLTNEFNFQIEPLDEWYKLGDEVNITEFVDVSSIKVDRPKLYKNIEFKYQDSKSFMNQEYLQINNRRFGSLSNFFGYDGGDFKIELPFETLHFNKFDNTNIQVGYSLDKAPSNTPYVPKPVMLYLYENQTSDVDFWIDNGISPQNITSYVPFGQEIRYNSQDYSINFNQQTSSLTLNGVSNSLYQTYYFPYLANLFSNKTRIVTLKTILPLSLLNYISLDDAIIVRDKKYRINDMKSDLTTGEVEFVLISDWVVDRLQINTPVLGKSSQTIDVPLKSINGDLGGTLTLSGSSDFVTPVDRLPLVIDGEQIAKFDVDENLTYSTRTATFDLLYTLPNGDTISKNLYFIQQGIPAEEIALDFQTRVDTDSGIFEAEQCLIDTLNTLL